MAFSVEYSNMILKSVFAKGTFSSPDAVWIGLTDGTNELSGGGYSRIMISKRNSTVPDVLGEIAEGVVQNTKQINWTKASDNWVTATGFGLYSTETGGEPFFTGDLEEPVTVEKGDVALFDPGTLRISFSG